MFSGPQSPPLADIVSAVVAAFVHVKTERIGEASVAATLDSRALGSEGEERGLCDANRRAEDGYRCAVRGAAYLRTSMREVKCALFGKYQRMGSVERRRTPNAIDSWREVPNRLSGNSRSLRSELAVGELPFMGANERQGASRIMLERSARLE